MVFFYFWDVVQAALFHVAKWTLKIQALKDEVLIDTLPFPEIPGQEIRTKK